MIKSAVVYHKEIKVYDFQEGHPFRGDRFGAFLNFFESSCPSFGTQFQKIIPEKSIDQILRLVHTPEYISAFRRASGGAFISDIDRYVSADNINPLTGNVPAGIEEAAKLIVGTSVLAGELVVQGKFTKAIGIGGGLHHAKPSYGEGFCFYNDVAICVKNLQQKFNAKRILVLDTDAHAGNGTSEIFYTDSSVLFIDLHQDPATIYPGTGFISEIGAKQGTGFTVNLPLAPGTAHDAYQFLFEEIIFPLAREFKPEVIIRYGGSDPHYLDQLTNLGLTLDGFRMIGEFVSQMANELCQGKSVDLLASGYNLEVLPFAWSALLCGLLNLDIDLSGLAEKDVPKNDYGLQEAKDMAGDLKGLLKKYWRCMTN